MNQKLQDLKDKTEFFGTLAKCYSELVAMSEDLMVNPREAETVMDGLDAVRAGTINVTVAQDCLRVIQTAKATGNIKELVRCMEVLK